MTVVVAPAGFGKTTALRHLVNGRTDAVFVQTRQGSSLETFLRTFAASCTAIFPAMLTPPEQPTTESAAALEIYVLWATTHLRNSNCLIVIDDLQYGDNDPAISAFVTRIVDRTKDSVRWLLSTRNRGLLPVSRWQAYGDADAPITAEDLRLTLDEAVAFASRIGSPASANDLQRWLKQTDGFAVPMSYAIRLSSRRKSVDGIIDGTRAVTFDFLAEQLWSSLSSNDRSLLELSAFLPATRVHDLEKFGIREATLRVARLTADIAFLAVTSDGIFTMHDLFRDFIRGQINLAGPVALKNRVKRAVKVLLDTRQYDEALRLLLTQNDLEPVLLALDASASSSIDHATIGQLVAAFRDVLPSGLNLEALSLHTEYWASNGDWHKSRSYAAEILSREAAHSSQVLKALRATLQAIYLEPEIERRKWLQASAAHVDRLNRNDRTVYDAFRASILAQFEEFRIEARALIEGIGADVSHMEPTAAIDTQLALSNAHYFFGETTCALRFARAAVATAATVDDLRESARALNTLGIMLTYARDPEVELLFEPLRQAVEQTGSWRYGQISHWFPAIYFGFKGDATSAENARRLQLIVPVTEGPQRSRLSSFQRHSRNIGHLIEEQYRNIVEDYLRVEPPEERDLQYPLLVDAAIAYSLLSDFEASEDVLKKARLIRETFSQREVDSVAESVILEVICLGASGFWPQARRLIPSIKTFSSTFAPAEIALERFAQGPPFSGLDDALTKCEGRPYLGLPSLVLRRSADRLANRKAAISLTNAELAVLRQIVLGKSNKEIADARNRSSETVKRQVATLYRKLGVENRTSALAVARERGLL